MSATPTASEGGPSEATTTTARKSIKITIKKRPVTELAAEDPQASTQTTTAQQLGGRYVGNTAGFV